MCRQGDLKLETYRKLLRSSGLFAFFTAAVSLLIYLRLSIPRPVFAQSYATLQTIVPNRVFAGSGAVSGRDGIDIFDTDGNPLPVTLNGERKSTFSYAIPPHGR